jgi:hypothetical protein
MAKVAAPVRSAIAACIAGEKPWPLLIVGGPRSGKTSAALCLLDACGGRYWTAADWTRTLARAGDGRLYTKGQDGCDYGVSESTLWTRMEHPWSVVCVDELEKMAEVADIDGIVERRQGLGLVLVFGGELASMADVFGASLAGVMASGTVLTMTRVGEQGRSKP